MRTLPFPAAAALLASMAATSTAQNDKNWVYYDSSGSLVYLIDGDDEARIADYSRSGYAQGSPVPVVRAADLPSSRVKIIAPSTVPATDRAAIQEAFDELAGETPIGLPNGPEIRGIVILDGTPDSNGEVVFRIDQTLRIRASGIILRGRGTSSATERTVLRGQGTAANPLILVQDAAYDYSPGVPCDPPDVPCEPPDFPNVNSRRAPDSTREVAAVYHPPGSTHVEVVHANGLAIGDEVLVHRIAHDGTFLGTDYTPPAPDLDSKWIEALDNSSHNALSPHWSPSSNTKWKLESGPENTLGSYDHYWTRTVLDIVPSANGQTLALDAPIFAPLHWEFGVANVSRFVADDMVTTVGIEDLVLESLTLGGAVPTGTIENHPKNGVSFGAARNCWMRGVHGLYFMYSLVTTQRDTQWISLLGCRFEEPVSAIDGGDRYAFNILGQDHLVYRCYARDAALSFVTQGNKDEKKDGPSTGIAFVECVAERMYSEVGPHSYGTTGNLWDNVLMKHPRMNELSDDRAFVLGFNGWADHGWTALSSIAWNCRCVDANGQRIGRFVVERPTGSADDSTPLKGWRNWAIGCDGASKIGGGGTFDYWQSTYVVSHPLHGSFNSLYRLQLYERFGYVWLPELYLSDFD